MSGISFGQLLTPYETGGKGTSAISLTPGDIGGASYGKFQLSERMGSLAEFMNLLKANNPDAYNELSQYTDSAHLGKKGNFGQTWLKLAQNGALQPSEEAYARSTYLKGGLSKLSDSGLAKRIADSPVLSEVFLSTAVQHGAKGSSKIFNKVVNSNMSDKDIIEAVYNERGRKKSDGSLAYFASNSPAVQRSVANRFVREKQDALALLGANVNPNQPRMDATGLASSEVNPSIRGLQIRFTPIGNGLVQQDTQIPQRTNSIPSLNYAQTLFKNNQASMQNMINGNTGLAGMVGTLGTTQYNPIVMG